MKKVVIVGCGFGGLNVAKGLAGDHDFQVLILDRRNHHLFQPLLYQVAMAGLSATEISTPIRSVFRYHKNIRVLMAEVTDIDPDQNRVTTNVGHFDYDYLIVACGTEDSYFGHDNWKEYAPGLKSVEQAMEIRRRVLTAFEKAESESNPAVRQALMTFAVVGGGPTGVEIAGSLGEITRYTLQRDFRHISSRSAKIILIEAGPGILASFHPSLGRRAELTLKKLGVEICTSSKVTDINEMGLSMDKGTGGKPVENKFIESRTVIWAAGVRPSSLNKRLGGTILDRQGRAIITADLSLPLYENVFVIGDQAALVIDGKTLPGLAPIAIQQGQHVAKQIRSGTRKPFAYFDKGQMATIGRKSAVVEIGKLKFSGFFAWLLWLLIHVYFLIGFKNRFFVIWEWAFSYFSYRKGARLITAREWESAEGSGT